MTAVVGDVKQFVKKYLEDILSFFELNSEVSVKAEGEVVKVQVLDTGENSVLIGRAGVSLKALQHIVLLALKQAGYDDARVDLDIGGYKEEHNHKLAEKTKNWIEEVLRTGEAKRLDLNPADRRIVHGVVSESPDVKSSSHGEGKGRYLLIEKA